ncbi:phospholipase A [uncultured Aquimarina sp.]|uniref:phospholipase A n=1 Tax=uncultured Aquimarina sp. TaxID=575652 RepID=UPI00260EBA41|nr:phospholipase A [uncultured Aquimarina sp.]
MVEPINKIFRKVIITVMLSVLTFSVSHSQIILQDTEGSLSKRWQIKSDSIKRFKIEPYKPVYFLLANYTTDINNFPTSDNPLNSVEEPSDFSDTELKFQLSFKTRAVRNLFGKKIGGDLWVGYTQSSRWQLYSANISRPFRETNYEPELMLVFPTPYKILGLNGVLAGVGINHQSNGRSNPLSRSWNRIILQFGWENPSWSFMLRPWWRLPEDAVEDNNPGIENYVGRTEFLAVFSKGKHDISILAKHSLRGGDKNRGSIRLDYAIEVLGQLQIHAQIFHGYGESLIDYNHSQTTFGIGLSLLQWR